MDTAEFFVEGKDYAEIKERAARTAREYLGDDMPFHLQISASPLLHAGAVEGHRSVVRWIATVEVTP